MQNPACRGYSRGRRPRVEGDIGEILDRSKIAEVDLVMNLMWIAFIAGPLALVAALFFLSWRLKARLSLPRG